MGFNPFSIEKHLQYNYNFSGFIYIDLYENIDLYFDLMNSISHFNVIRHFLKMTDKLYFKISYGFWLEDLIILNSNMCIEFEITQIMFH